MKTGEMLDVDEIVQMPFYRSDRNCLDDDDVIKASNQGEPIALDPNNKASMAYRNIARRILGETVPLQSLDESTGMLKRVKKFFGIRS